MNIESINFELIIYSILCIVLGFFACWFYLKKTVLAQAVEIENLEEDFKLLQHKYETLQLDKIEIHRKQTGFRKSKKVLNCSKNNLPRCKY